MHGFLLTKIGELKTNPLISRITSRAEFKVRSTGTSSNSNDAWNAEHNTQLGTPARKALEVEQALGMHLGLAGGSAG
jgi:hypothetical protein